MEQANSVGDALVGGKGTPHPTLTSFNANEYTLEGLFAAARNSANSDFWTEDVNFAIEFNTIYGFPQRIFTGNYRYTDVQVDQKVMVFQELI